MNKKGFTQKMGNMLLAVTILVIIIIVAIAKIKSAGDNAITIVTNPLFDLGISNYKCSSEPDDFAWPLPVSGDTRITSCFGPRDCSGISYYCDEDHKGIDISAVLGTPVKAAMGGEVIFVGGDFKSVTIEHSNGYVTSYIHNSEILVSKGDTVNTGDIIAKTGDTGSPGSYHLDFRMTNKAGEYENVLCHFDAAKQEALNIDPTGSNCPLT